MEDLCGGGGYNIVQLFCSQGLEGRYLLGDLDGTVMLHLICIQTFGDRLIGFNRLTVRQIGRPSDRGDGPVCSQNRPIQIIFGPGDWISVLGVIRCTGLSHVASRLCPTFRSSLLSRHTFMFNSRFRSRLFRFRSLVAFCLHWIIVG